MKQVDAISTLRYMVGESGGNAIKTLKLKCQDRFLEFSPEGINLDNSRGRIRVKHNATRTLPPFVYLHLVVDLQSNAPYPENLVWVWNEKNAENFDSLPPFNDEVLEHLVETIFLE
jgi:hypothetical protein